jgi:hypothetical protein
MVPHKIKNLTLECGVLWNTIILKSEPLYCAFTLLQEHHLNKDECLKFKEVVEFKNETIMWNPTIQLGRSLRWSIGTSILVSPKLTPVILDHGIIMQGQPQFLLLKILDGDVFGIVNMYVAQTSCE